jgi:hypothetical protein
VRWSGRVRRIPGRRSVLREAGRGGGGRRRSAARIGGAVAPGGGSTAGAAGAGRPRSSGGGHAQPRIERGGAGGAAPHNVSETVRRTQRGSMRLCRSVQAASVCVLEAACLCAASPQCRPWLRTLVRRVTPTVAAQPRRPCCSTRGMVRRAPDAKWTRSRCIERKGEV